MATFSLQKYIKITNNGALKINKGSQVTRPQNVRAARGFRVVAMAEPREDVRMYETQGNLPEDVENFDYGHADFHHTFKESMASGIIAGDNHKLFKSHMKESLESAGGPIGPQGYLVLGSIPAALAIIFLGGGTPETSGVFLCFLGAAVSAAYTVFEQLEEIKTLPSDESTVAEA
eukprot:CAMPEP_0196574330 /NCGR_PEP_ID=MMETSP1081-20130531/4065_1 /TAXON_ID=36882 /ORGANISM="Pyramimonas amylifera, Strain CCMP720" /LENGTH=174 /DNA_ID=CAMNT_0041892321 /DNA_START=83 /DNA_END=607 /DNA_ORIENTATION=+